MKKEEKKHIPWIPMPAWPMNTGDPIHPDPLGMYTGIPYLTDDPEPVQDADDL